MAYTIEELRKIAEEMKKLDMINDDQLSSVLSFVNLLENAE